MNLNTYTKRAMYGGILALVFIFISTLLIGRLGGYEAKALIEKSLEGINTLCNTIVLASATILALLLTLLGLSSSSNSKLTEDHYKRVMQIAKIDTGVFIASLMSFLLFNLPVTESENVPTYWYDTIYYSTLGISALLSSALVVVVLMLYNTVVNIIKIVGLGVEDHPWAEVEDENKELDNDKEDAEANGEK